RRLRAATHAGRRGHYDWIGAGFRLLDGILRRAMGIEDFCTDDACVIGIALARAQRDVRLADGTCIREGETIGELHLRNGNLPKLANYASAVAWALAVRRAFEFSFTRLARYIETDPRFDGVKAFRGGLAFARRANRELKVRRVMARLDIELVPSPPAAFAPLREFGNAAFTMFLIRGFARGGTFGAPRLRRRQRHDLWLSRRVLRERYGGRPGDAVAGAAAAAEPAGHKSAA
ncbi:MAG TPA: hypothetical protein VKV32_15085, partial [Stellaceae bacterium]|nr:hypothetical protein [Stellaceae bacterium]